MNFHEPAVLGRTGLNVGRLGIASAYGAPTTAIEEAFERLLARGLKSAGLDRAEVLIHGLKRT